MSKPFTNPFFEADMSKMFDMSKMIGGADMAKMFDMSKMLDMWKSINWADMWKPDTWKPIDWTDACKMGDMSKMMGDYKMPMFDIEAFTALQRKNMEAFAAMSQASYESMTALWRRQADSYRQAMEEMMQVMQGITACTTPEAKAIKQAEVSKAAMDKYIANLRDASETLAKCNTHAVETVGARLNESLNEVYGMVKSASRVAA